MTALRLPDKEEWNQPWECWREGTFCELAQAKASPSGLQNAVFLTTIDCEHLRRVASNEICLPLFSGRLLPIHLGVWRLREIICH